MRARIIVVFAAGLFLTANSFIPGPARAQSATPAVQAGTSKPIGKVVTVIGSATIEHVNAVVVQANVASQPEQTKVGDPVYLGDVSRPQPTAGSASPLRMARRSICPVMPEWL